MPKIEILHWMQCEEQHLNIPAYYNILSNAALLVQAGMGCAVCLDGALSIHADPELCFRQITPGTYYKECDPVEEESSVFPGGITFRTDDTTILKMAVTSDKTLMSQPFLIYGKRIVFHSRQVLDAGADCILQYA